jgi:hypothetical protein
MKLRNTTDIPNGLAREVISFVKPPGISRFDVMLKNSSYTFYGRSYDLGSQYHATSSPFVVLRLGKDDRFPIMADEKQQRKNGYLPTPRLDSRLEAMVYVAAHELRHQWQAKHAKGKVWGARGRFSERDADAYAIRKLREWRKRSGNILAELPTWFLETGMARAPLRDPMNVGTTINSALSQVRNVTNEQLSWYRKPTLTMVPTHSIVSYVSGELGLHTPKADDLIEYGRGRRPIISVQLQQQYLVVYGYIEWRWRERNHEREVPVYVLPIDRNESEAFVRVDLDSDPYAKGEACKTLMRSENLAGALGVERVTQEKLGKLLNVSDATVSAWVQISDMSKLTRQKFSVLKDTRSLQQIASLPSDLQNELAQELPSALNKRELVISFAKATKADPHATAQEVKLTLATQEALVVDLGILTRGNVEYKELLARPEFKQTREEEYVDTSVYEQIFSNILDLAEKRGIDLNEVFGNGKT